MNQKKIMRFTVIFLIFLMVGGFLFANGNKDTDDYYRGRGYGHMGSGRGQWGSGGYGYGRGMMGDFYNGQRAPSAERITSEDAEHILETYVQGAFGSDYHIEEIMEFEFNFYAQIGREGEETLAVELLIDPYTGQVFPEHGPNMMWNQSYGHMRRATWGSREMNISEADSVQIAQEYLDYHNSGLMADSHADKFDGYYTLHTMKEGEITGMLSVNGFTSEVWYHDWHGDFLGKEDSLGHDD